MEGYSTEIRQHRRVKSASFVLNNDTEHFNNGPATEIRPNAPSKPLSKWKIAAARLKGVVAFKKRSNRVTAAKDWHRNSDVGLALRRRSSTSKLIVEQAAAALHQKLVATASNRLGIDTKPPAALAYTKRIRKLRQTERQPGCQLPLTLKQHMGSWQLAEHLYEQDVYEMKILRSKSNLSKDMCSPKNALQYSKRRKYLRDSQYKQKKRIPPVRKPTFNLRLSIPDTLSSPAQRQRKACLDSQEIPQVEQMQCTLGQRANLSPEELQRSRKAIRNCSRSPFVPMQRLKDGQGNIVFKHSFAKTTPSGPKVVLSSKDESNKCLEKESFAFEAVDIFSAHHIQKPVGA